MKVFWANLSHILLDGPFTDANIQLEQFTPNALRAPEPIIGGHLLDQTDCLKREPWLLRMDLRFAFPEPTKEFPMPAKEGLWLDEEECLLPGPCHPGQKDQKKPVSFPEDGPFDLSTEDDQLVTQECVFRQQFSFASGEIGERAEYKGSRWWFDPTQKTFLERVNAEADALLDQSEHTTHELNLPPQRWVSYKTS